ncbi:disease resistance protein RUN1 isoform X2 [Vitis vinifera]|uniref:disease resistance protein RUN1 isoform X2 n=1 Tax=Vitis vinifera TaxID=29760 RepID=UPI00053F46E5|nr:disease resistance protein RUN1 isoform X2 [Vitis vinifera]|eukprot:XP_010645868.1 PREDICTED: TMV resistance protein N isoform X2 [Vitis vinifera]
MASVDSTFAPQWKYDVFLSFRGEDTGKTFTDHLYTALDENGFYAFRDDEKHEKREEIAPEFLTAIEESKISILVFSKNYASSRWCLDELETIIKSMKKPGRMVMPVFYHVDPSEVRDQIGSCEVFLSHERDAEETKEKVNRWRAALREASNLVGWRLHNQYESQLIKEIITDILRRLNCELLQVDYDTVGMEFRLKKLLSLINLKLDKVLMIGINGISGIGKTTIAKAIYNKISYHFQSTIFLTNVGENSRGHHLNLPQFQQLLDDASIGTYGRTKNKRVLLVVDDVDRLSQVEYLVKLRDSFSLRSRIIFTTRDRHLLNVAKLDASYESKGLTHEEAIHLFSWHAFKQTFPKEDYVGLVNHVVGYVKGHPLALKVLGSSLFGKTITEWKCILHKLRKNTHGEIYNELKVSFDGLTPTEQEIFLKVVCLLKGKDEESVSTILDSLGLGSESGIQVLHDMCLATISNNKLYMHDLLQQMGQKLIDENNPHEPSKRSRLQDSKDVYPRLTRNTGTEEIQKIQFSSAGFLKMPKLYSLMHLPLKSLPPNFPGDSLIFLDWSRSNIRQLWKDEYPRLTRNTGTEAIQKLLSPMHLPLKSLPPNFPGDSLILLDLSRSNIRQLWKGNKSLGNLKVMNLSYCQNLVKISKFPSMPALKILRLKGCKKLRSLPSSICELKCLECLWCSGCSNLEAFPEITEKMENLKELHLDETAIKELPSSIYHLTALEFLNLEHCKNLVSLPSGISKLEHLKSICLCACSKLKSLPPTPGRWNI